MTAEAYREVALHGPNLAELGGALVTVVEPDEGRASDFNRWYEDDHFYAGCMMGPWIFAGRRYAATPSQVAHSYFAPGVEDTRRGRLMSVFWHTAGHIDDARTWALAALGESLVPQGRVLSARTHRYTAFHELAFSHVADPPPMRDVHALDVGYPGAVLELFDLLPGVDRTVALERMRDQLPATASAAGAGQMVVLVPRPFEQSMAEMTGWGGQDPERRICVLWFTHAASETLPPVFAQHGTLLADVVIVRSILPFAVTSPGTDRLAGDFDIPGSTAP